MSVCISFLFLRILFFSMFYQSKFVKRLWMHAPYKYHENVCLKTIIAPRNRSFLLTVPVIIELNRFIFHFLFRNFNKDWIRKKGIRYKVLNWQTVSSPRIIAIAISELNLLRYWEYMNWHNLMIFSTVHLYGSSYANSKNCISKQMDPWPLK